VYSTNWSGQILTGGSYNGVGGDWAVPSVAASSSDEFSASWLGIDGTSSASLIQTGTAQQVVGGVTDYYAWVELLPGAEGIIGNASGPAPVAPGDQIDAAVFETTTPNVWTIEILDSTQSWEFSQNFPYTTPGTSAEWIEEAPTVDGSQSTLANFGAVTFTSLAQTGSGSSNLVPAYMLDPTASYIVAYPGAYDSATNAFSDFYGTPAPVVTSVTPNQGYATGGTSVTIAGNFLIGANAVHFGSTGAGFTTNFSTLTLTAVTPAESVGAVDVTVTTPGGTSGLSSADQFTFISPPASGVYVPLAPVRICDTRPGNPSHLTGSAAQCSNGTAGTTLAANGTVSFGVAGAFGVPSSAVTAAVLNVTAVGAKAAGFLTVYPAGQARPGASNVNYVAGQAVPNLAEVGLGAGGQVTIFSASASDVVVDLEGYVTTTPQSGAGLYNALSTPARICDTRGSNPSHLVSPNTQCNTNTASGSPDHLLGPSTPISITVEGNGGVPSSGVSAVVLNLTVTKPTAAGFVTAYPTGQSKPVASNVNYNASQTVANRVIVPVGTNGQVSLFSSSPTDLVVDVSGWYTSTGGTSGAEFTPELAPVRICDTRGSNPSHLATPNTQCNLNITPGGPANPLVAGTPRTIQASGLAGVPSGASAAVLNVTDVAPTAPGFLTVYPQGSPPTTSDVNPPVGGSTLTSPWPP
jgi:hypothetical protein